MQEALDKYYKNHRSFLNYSWGVFVTAYARRELEDGLNIAGLDTIYCDTDSVKFIGNHDKEFEAYNERLNKECEEKGIRNYTEVNGKRYYMGIFDKEKGYDEFITLGAKKYAFLPIGVHGAKMSILKQIESGIPAMKLQGTKFSSFFKWLSASMGTVVSAEEGQQVDLSAGAEDWMSAFTI